MSLLILCQSWIKKKLLKVILIFFRLTLDHHSWSKEATHQLLSTRHPHVKIFDSFYALNKEHSEVRLFFCQKRNFFIYGSFLQKCKNRNKPRRQKCDDNGCCLPTPKNKGVVANEDDVRTKYTILNIYENSSVSKDLYANVSFK